MSESWIKDDEKWWYIRIAFKYKQNFGEFRKKGRSGGSLDSEIESIEVEKHQAYLGHWKFYFIWMVTKHIYI